MLTLTDITGQRVVVRAAAVTAVIIPSPLSPGPGKCFVVVPGIVSEVSHAEAERVVALLEAQDQPTWVVGSGS